MIKKMNMINDIKIIRINVANNPKTGIRIILAAIDPKLPPKRK